MGNYFIRQNDRFDDVKSVDNAYISAYHPDCTRCKYRNKCKVYGKVAPKCVHADECINYARCNDPLHCVSSRYNYAPSGSNPNCCLARKSDWETIVNRLMDLGRTGCDFSGNSDPHYGPDYFDSLRINIDFNKDFLTKLIYGMPCIMEVRTTIGTETITYYSGTTPSVMHALGGGYLKTHTYQEPDENGNPVAVTRAIIPQSRLVYLNAGQYISNLTGEYGPLRGAIIATHRLTVTKCEDCGGRFAPGVTICPLCGSDNIGTELVSDEIIFAPVIGGKGKEKSVAEGENINFFISGYDLFNTHPQGGHYFEYTGKLRLKDDLCCRDCLTGSEYEVIKSIPLTEGTYSIIELPTRLVRVYTFEIDEGGDPYVKWWSLYMDNYNVYIPSSYYAANHVYFEMREDCRNKYIRPGDYIAVGGEIVAKVVDIRWVQFSNENLDKVDPPVCRKYYNRRAELVLDKSFTLNQTQSVYVVRAYDGEKKVFYKGDEIDFIDKHNKVEVNDKDECVVLEYNAWSSKKIVSYNDVSFFNQLLEEIKAQYKILIGFDAVGATCHFSKLDGQLMVDSTSIVAGSIDYLTNRWSTQPDIVDEGGHANAYCYLKDSTDENGETHPFDADIFGFTSERNYGYGGAAGYIIRVTNLPLLNYLQSKFNLLKTYLFVYSARISFDKTEGHLSVGDDDYLHEYIDSYTHDYIGGKYILMKCSFEVNDDNQVVSWTPDLNTLKIIDNAKIPQYLIFDMVCFSENTGIFIAPHVPSFGVTTNYALKRPNTQGSGDCYTAGQFISETVRCLTEPLQMCVSFDYK